MPCNPLLAEALYLTKHIERMGTGTRDMIERCRKAGLDEPQFALTDGFVFTLRRQPERPFKAVGGEAAKPVPVTPPVSPPVEVLLRLLDRAGALGNAEIRTRLGLKDRTHLGERYLDPALAEGLIEQTFPDKPRSRFQQYRLTAKGVALVVVLKRT